MLSDFSFHVNFGSGEIQLYPLNDDLLFSDKQDDAFGFYRRTLDTELVFKRDSFYAIYAVEQSNVCQNFDVDIRYKGQPFYVGIMKFRTSNMKWDIDKCRVDVKLDPQDDYTCLIDNWELEFNAMSVIYNRDDVTFLAGTLEETTCVHNEQTDGIYPQYEDYVTDCIPSGEGWTPVEHTVQNNATPGFYTVTTKYTREVITMDCLSGGGGPPQPPGDGWVLTADNCPTNATFARGVPTQFNPGASFDLGSGAPGDLWYKQVFDVITGIGIDTIDNAVLFNDVFGNEFTKIGCKGLGLRSNFLNLNPQGASPTTKPYTEPRTHKLVFFQKTDITTYAAGQNATFHLWSFKGMLDVLASLYDVQLRVIGNDVRVEHRTYFEGTNDLDLTSPTYEKYIEGFNQYDYDTLTMPRKETWRYRENVSLPFAGSPIIYDCFANDDNPEILYDIPDVNNDVGFMLGNPTLVSKEGFVIAETEIVNSARVMVSRTIYNDTYVAFNAAHAIPNLIDHFWRWERPNLTGTMNDSLETFNTTIRRKKQVQLDIKMSTEDYRDLNPDNLIKTQISWGKAKEYRWSAKSCRLSVTVYHS